MKYPIFLLILLLGFCSCTNFPKDPEKTLQKVKNGTLVVGYSENPPWVVKTDSIPGGIEPELVKAFAKTLNAKVEWKNGTEQNLVEDLEKKKVHLFIAGITDDSPWKNKAGFTRPFAKVGKSKHVMAAINGENAFVVQLEQFLHQRELQIKALVQP